MEGNPCEITCINSYVENQSCIFHEDIPVPGTDLTPSLCRQPDLRVQAPGHHPGQRAECAGQPEKYPG